MSSNRVHAVCIPYPAQGHINPMLNLATLLHHKHFHITFVHTEYNAKRLLRSRGSDSLNGLPDFQFKTIPDGLPSSDDIDTNQDLPALCDSLSKKGLVPFRDLIANLNNSTSNLPPVSCIVSDAVMTFPLQVAQELGIPGVLVWTTGACGFLGYLQVPYLIEKGLVPFKDMSYTSNGYLDTPIDWIPEVQDLRLRDLPSFIRTTDPHDIMINFISGVVEGAPKASAIVVNTFDELEHDVLSAIKSVLLPPIYTTGSLHLLVNQMSVNGRLNSIKSNLWRDEDECLQWLDSKEHKSVLYVSFGSLAVMTPQQMIELAWGLANSKHNFLWVIRPDLVSGNTALLPPQFITETKERGMLASWCPQEQVLNHSSIGGFLTHSGWNSTLESVCSGVPMICCPFFAEQQMNCRYSCVHWGIGMEIDSSVKRDEVESLVRELMEGKKGKDMKTNALKWKKIAAQAAAPGGSSYQNIDKLVTEILLAKNTD